MDTDYFKLLVELSISPHMMMFSTTFSCLQWFCLCLGRQSNSCLSYVSEKVAQFLFVIC